MLSMYLREESEEVYNLRTFVVGCEGRVNKDDDGLEKEADAEDDGNGVNE